MELNLLVLSVRQGFCEGKPAFAPMTLNPLGSTACSEEPHCLQVKHEAP